MTKITESEIKNFTIKLLEKQGFEYIYAPEIAPFFWMFRGLTRTEKMLY